MAAVPPVCDFGWKAVDFSLPATDGKRYALGEVAGEKGTLIAFICNHCPYVKAVIDRFVQDAGVLAENGIGVAAVCSNDAVNYPADSFENMAKFAEQHGFPFPYLHDESQAVAKAYDAICTPDWFGFNADLELQFRGRLDAGKLDAPPPGAPRELVDAMLGIAATGKGPADQIASMGCSIKWKT